MSIDKLKKDYELINIFCILVEIASPSLKEDKVADKIINILKKNSIQAKKDSFGNVIGKISATDNSKKPILLSAHMDVVGDDSPVLIKLNGNFIETDKKRTLGADDKAGVAAAILLTSEIKKDNTLKHGGIELVFTRDEEHSMSGISNVNMKNLESEYILVLDADKKGDILISGASYTKVILEVNAFKGGHSGIDITDKTRLNAVKLISEIVNDIPQGVYTQDELGVVTSINIGAIIGGGVNSAFDKLCKNIDAKENYQDLILNSSMTNIINTKAGAIYSIRSSAKDSENKLIAEIQGIIDKFNDKYHGFAQAKITVKTHLLPFEKNEDETIIKTAKIASEQTNTNIKISSFHAGAETHIYANNTNKYGKVFKPCLIGVADIYNMHSADEKIDYKSYLEGYEFLKEIFKVYNS